jgi:Domain of unknown function (DUF2019)
MKTVNLEDFTTDQLVKQFAEIALKQNNALLDNDISEVNRLFWQLEAVEGELKSRSGDQRSALLRLYHHPNAQVRLKAVKATLAVAPESARRMLAAIAQSREYPQAGEAGMSLRALERGIFKPK